MKTITVNCVHVFTICLLPRYSFLVPFILLVGCVRFGCSAKSDPFGKNMNLITIELIFNGKLQVWFSNRRAKWRREEKLRTQRRSVDQQNNNSVGGSVSSANGQSNGGGVVTANNGSSNNNGTGSYTLYIFHIFYMSRMDENS